MISLPLLKHLVYNLGVRVISVTDGIDSDNTAWELIAHIMSIISEQYVRDLAANVFRGQEARCCPICASAITVSGSRPFPFREANRAAGDATSNPGRCT